MAIHEKGPSDNPIARADFPYSFSSLNPTEYYGLVIDSVNSNNLERISHTLESIELPKGILLAVSGSDGKLEQHAQSKTELIVIQESADLNGAAIVQNFFGKERYMELFDTGPDGIIETKSLDQNTLFSYAFNDPNSPYPDRTLNMFPVYPTSVDSLEVYYCARERILEEMSTDKHTRTKLRDQLRSYKRSMKTGEYRRIPIFSSEQHLQYYSEMWPAYSTGFKTSFLRTVQRKLDLLTIALGDQKRWSEVAREIPTTTLGRLEYLSQANIISPADAASTSEAYAWFLQQYHRIQEIYKQDGGPVELPYDPILFDAYYQDIENFSNLQA